jgi:hypothetical protein
MALQLKINIEEKENSFVVVDLTGKYRYDNLTGWGPATAEVKNISKATLSIWKPGATQPKDVDVTGDFPNKECIDIEILPYMAGLTGSVLVSGKYKVKLTVEGTDCKGATYSKSATVEKVFVNDVTCCLDKLQKRVNRDAYQEKLQQNIIILSNLLESANYAICKGLTEQASEIVELLKSQCSCVDC